MMSPCLLPVNRFWLTNPLCSNDDVLLGPSYGLDFPWFDIAVRNDRGFVYSYFALWWQARSQLAQRPPPSPYCLYVFWVDGRNLTTGKGRPAVFGFFVSCGVPVSGLASQSRIGYGPTDGVLFFPRGFSFGSLFSQSCHLYI